VNVGDDFAGARFEFGNVGVAEDFRAAVVVEEDGFHNCRSILAWTRNEVKQQTDAALTGCGVGLRLRQRPGSSLCRQAAPDNAAAGGGTQHGLV